LIKSRSKIKRVRKRIKKGKRKVSLKVSRNPLRQSLIILLLSRRSPSLDSSKSKLIKSADESLH